MRYYIIIILAVVVSCKQKEKKAPDTTPEKPKADTTTTTTQQPRQTVDTSLYFVSDTILMALRKGDYARVARFAHPIRGIRFSPYAYVDTMHHKVLFERQILDAFRTREKLTWGSYDGTGDPIELSVPDYFKKFVYPADFLYAKQRALNHFIGAGNSLNNLETIYPGCEFTEHYFPGFDPKYEGMDWQTLRLVYKREGDIVYLVGIVHDQWTT